MRKLLILACALVLGACAGTTTGQLTEAEKAAMTPQHHVFAAREDYNRLLTVVVDYASQPECTEIVIVACSDTVAVATSLSWLDDADKALDAAEVIVRGGGATPDGLLSTSRGALAKLSTYLIAREIAK